jgi:hypothetical protein
MSVDLKITNPKTGLSKTVNADSYTVQDFKRTFEVYVDAGFSIKIIRGARKC